MLHVEGPRTIEEIQTIRAAVQGPLTANFYNLAEDLTPERAVELGKQKGKTRPVIVHCQNGTRSAAGMAMLSKHGFEKVFTLAGGITAWKAAGLPMEK